jgi:uncharacterized membrane protein YbaN (DUF454 family)
MPPSERWRRGAWLTAGLLALGAGTIGIALPLLPTVPFYLLAAFCFARSRPEWAERLYGHPRYGPPLQAWRERRAIGRRAKVSALIALAASVAVVELTLGWPWVLIPAAVALVSGGWIWTRAE